MAEQELTDLRVAGEDIVVEDGGDLAMIDGFDNVLQSVALDARNVTYTGVGDQLTELNIYDMRSAIEDSLRNDPQITDPISVEPTQIDEETNEVTFEVTTKDNEEFTLDLVIPD